MVNLGHNHLLPAAEFESNQCPQFARMCNRLNEVHYRLPLSCISPVPAKKMAIFALVLAAAPSMNLKIIMVWYVLSFDPKRSPCIVYGNSSSADFYSVISIQIPPCDRNVGEVGWSYDLWARLARGAGRVLWAGQVWWLNAIERDDLLTQQLQSSIDDRCTTRILHVAVYTVQAMKWVLYGRKREE